MPRLLLPFVALFMFSAPAFAHKLNIDPRVKGDRLHVEVFFEDDTPAQQAKVTVLNGDTVVAEGRTDEKGVWSCPKPGPGTYVVKGESHGHSAKETVVVADDVGVPPSKADAGLELPLLDESGSMVGSDRQAKTRTPWMRVAIGLGAILVLTLLFMLSRRGRSTAAPTE